MTPSRRPLVAPAGVTALAAFAVLLLPVAKAAAQAPTNASPPPAAVHLTPGAAAASQELIDTLAAKDRALFEAVFGCRLDILTPLIATDFEFLHDKGGMTARSGKEFLDQVAKGCELQKAGTNFKARRELVPGTMTVYVLNHYGAMQMGTHRFYALQDGKPDRLTETGKFIDIWVQDGTEWKLARVISYDHHLAE